MDRARRRLLSEQLPQEKAYWLNKLSGDLTVSAIPLDRKRPDVFSPEKKSLAIDLDAESAGKLLKATNQNEFLIFTILVTVLKVCLAKYNDVADVIVGTTIHKRQNEDALLNEVLVLRDEVRGEATVRELLRDVKNTIYEAFSNQRFPFESILELLHIPVPENRTPLFNVVVLLENLNENFLDLKNDVTLIFSIKDGRLTGSIEFNSALFNEKTLERFAGHFNNVLRAVVANPDQKISAIELLSPAEKQALIFGCNDTHRGYPSQQPIHQLFEDQVVRTPENIALVSGEERLSYRELNERANQLAHYLRESGVGPDVLVGVMMERSLEMMIALLGVLKAGGAYVPLEVQYPAERIAYMVEDTKAPVVLTQERLISHLASHQARKVCLDSQWVEISKHSTANPEPSAIADNLAYVIYTSGSTGRPKGVGVPQRAVVRLVKETNFFELQADETFLQLAPLAFDASTFEIWGSLLNGARLALMPSRQPSLTELGEALKLHSVTTLWLTAGLFHLMVDERLADLTSLRQLLAGGDVLSVPHVQKFLREAKDCTLINGYGPTENTTFTCCYGMRNGEDLQYSVPIGFPIAHTQVYVLDQRLQPVPMGATGELYTGGDGLARGYFHDPQLTAERFIPHPFSNEGGQRLYRTGDLVRRLANGALEFIGRRDQQAKIRGFRIEPGEIEAVLGQCAGVRESAVVVRPDANGEKCLVAYIVPDPERRSSVTELQQYLKKKLPEYMLPTAFVMLDSLPLTANGKVDRHALPDPENMRPELEARYVKARTETEALLVSIWQNLLRTERVGVHDSFFDLGGHSLLATRLIMQVQQVFGVELPLWRVFEKPTVADMAEALDEAIRAGAKLPSIAAIERPERLPLSHAQQRLWFLDSLLPGTALYNVYTAFQLEGELNLPALERSLNEIVKRHEILRTTFPALHGQPSQKINEPEPLDLRVEDLTDKPDAEQLIKAEALRPFDLEHGPLFRARLLKQGEHDHVLLLTMHHIISDGWSLEVLTRELSALYEAFSNGQPAMLEELPLQYADYAVWQRQWLAGVELERQLKYWEQQLAEAPAVLELPTDKPRPSVQTHRGATQLFSVSEQVSTQLRELCRAEGVTLFMGLLAAFNVLLSRYSGQKEILVGTPIANRTRAELEPLIGFFSNTLVLRTNLTGGPSFRELLRRVREACLGAYAHQDVPFERLVEELSPERDLSRTPLFQVLFSLHGVQTNRAEISGLTLKPLRVETGTSKVDLSFYLRETENALQGAIEYSTDLFNEETIQRMSRHFHVLLEELVAEPEREVEELPLLTFAEEQQLLWEWNESERQYPRERSVAQLFEEQVQRTPAAIALVTEEESLTYAELNERANQVAGYLRELGVGPEVLVAVMLERSVELVVGLLGVLKAGGAYVPLDVQYPAERIAYMLADTQARVLLTQQKLLGQLPAHETRTVCIDSQWNEIARHARQNPESQGTGENLAYVIYTSGSTGKPKGICVTHKAINRLVLNTNYVQLSASDRIAQVSNSSFDAATFEIWGGLLNGARVEIIRKELVLDPGELSRQFKSRGITTTFLTTALFNRIAAEDGSAFRGVKQVLVGGEEVTPKGVREVLNQGKPERLLNCYGPTESTTFATWYEIKDVEEGATTVPIGSPISNTEVYILNEALMPAPVGIRGELYIGGDGLARGYLGRPKLTAEKFVPHPFSRVPGARLYKTGDVCRYRADGSIEFHGRQDHQIKLRGFRIELGEIEAALDSYEGVKKALAILVTDEVSNEKQIVAYLETAQFKFFETNELRGYLKEKLPEYMIPSSFVLMSSWPLTVNGKIDRAALPKPDSVQPELEIQEDRLQTGFEEMVIDIWREILGIDSIAVNDNFFDIGGHSLLATQVVSRVRERFGVQFKIGTVFERPTVAELAEAVATAIRGGESVQVTPIKPVNRKKQKLPLSYAQQRLWFLDQLMPGTTLYSVPILYRLNGELKIEALEKSVSEIIRRHESLRTRIEVSAGSPVQVIEKPRRLKLEVLDLSELKSDDREPEVQRLIKCEWQQPFDLEHGPFLRVKLIALNDREHLLAITMHHIISDGWSLEVLTRELSALYEAFSNGQPAMLEELPLQYADYAVWQRQWLAGVELERQLQYWEQQLAGAPGVLELPTDKPRPSVQTHRGATQFFSVSEQVSTQLRELCRAEGVTLFMGLLAAFNVLLSRYSGQKEILVGTPIANRTRAELEPLIGFFSNTLVLRTNLTGGPSFRELLRRVREACLGAYAHQDVPFERLVEELSPERDLSRTPLFQVMFSLQHEVAKRIELPGLSMFPSVFDTESSKFDLSLGMFERKQGLLKGAIEYSTDLFNEETIQRMSRHFHVLLEGLVAEPEREVEELPLLTFAEEQQLLWEWNESERQYPRERSVAQLFEEQVQRTPAAIALVTEEESLTYAELNERANQVAGYLRELGVGPEVLVAVMLERSVELVVGLLGVLKAGGAYVPLDVQYPAERIAYMLADTQARVLLTQQKLLGQLPAHEARTVCLDSQWNEIARHARQNPEPHGTGENLAYVIYTSGSTGKPKGVAIEHRSTVVFLHWALEVFDPQQLAGVLASTSICFDLSIFELFVPLSQGGKVILSENVLALPALKAADQVTLINTVPSGIAELVRMKGIPPSVRTINLAGEALKDSLVQEIYKQQTVDQVFNLYGPSEDTTYSTYTLVENAPDAHVTIGRPVANTQAYVLDARQHPVPHGVAGELCLGGQGLARCYLNRPELTAEKFIPNPFGKQPGSRLYRTGDLVRYLPDGKIEYLGRADHQIKLRGYRIELGEIEALLAVDPGVREAVVEIREENDGDKRLIAYVVAEQGFTLTDHRLREQLKEKLPQYMMPAAFVMMDALPLTPNGKVNRAALPKPVIVERQLPTALIMPRTEAEAAIAAVWQDVLHLDHVGMDDNFFDLGGHSLLLVQVHFKLQELFDQSLTVIDLFKYPTISALAKFLTGTESETIPLEVSATEVEHSSAHRDNAIAIIGMAARLPGSSTLDQFWENLKNGVESIKTFSDYELDSHDVGPATMKDPNYVKAGAFLDGIDLFDAPFFDFNPKEAEITDPQQRLFLECAWEALEQSGYAPDNCGRVGVFAGAGLSGYLQNLYTNPEVMRSTNAFQIVIGNDKDYLSTRVSYKLNLKGPSLTVQTACSTSLVAVHIACQSLLNGECELALAGGISIRVPQKVGYYYQEGGINSPDGHCRAFDVNAQGTVPGNGGGVVVLKRLADALADGDSIQAVILGSAINNDGSGKVGYTAPSIDGQAEVIARAQRAARIEPQTVTYVEAHGTGTPLGDPIELAALSQAFGSVTAKKNFCAIGSLKTNMGHLDAGAGVAGLIKTVLALKHQMIPPSLHFEQPIPGGNLDEGPFYINNTLRDWTTTGIPRRAGVSSFGIGGTNAHVILEEPPQTEARATSSGPYLLLLSAKTSSALDTMTLNLRDYLQQHDDVDLRDLAYTLQVGRRFLNHRRTLVCADLDDCVAQLSNSHGASTVVESRHRPVVFMYPGQGSQHVRMGWDLYKSSAVFREQVDHCSKLLVPHLGLDLRSLLYPRDEELEFSSLQLNQTNISQPALFVIEYALTQLWLELGLKPDATIGHSLGEYVSACIAGVFSLEDGLKLVAERGRLMNGMPQGSMLIVPQPEDEVRQLLNAELSLAAVNGPALCVVSGSTEAVDELERTLIRAGVDGHRLRTSHAFHSKMMEPIVSEFIEVMKSVALSPPKIPFLSNLTGTWITDSQAVDPMYWGNHLRQTVRFEAGLRELLKDQHTIALEVGPGKGLSSLARQYQSVAVSTLGAARSSESDEAHFLKTCGSLWLGGVRLNWSNLYGQEQPRRVALPTYPFERKRYWVESGKARTEPLPTVVVEQAQNGGTRRQVVEQVVAQQLQISNRQLEIMSQQLALLQSRTASRTNGSHRKPN